jgi:hypothetical protein
MTTRRSVDTLITAYLAEGPAELPDRSFESVRDEIERTRQRLPLGLPGLSRWSDSARLVAVATVLFVAFVGFNIVGNLGPRVSSVRSPSVGPSATPSPSAGPSATPAPSSATPAPSPAAPSLAPGRYELTADFPVAATLDLPPRWSECSSGPLEQSVCGADGPLSVSLMIIDNVVAAPCVDEGLDPPVGPTVDDLAAAIAALHGFRSTPPVDITIDGHPGVEFTVTAPSSSQCGLFTWMGPYRTNGVGLGEANRLRIVDVGGVRVLIAAAYHPSVAAPGFPDELKQVFESVRFP